MRCKIFNVRLSEDYNKSDESSLNNFLENVKVSRLYSSIISGSVTYWSVLVFYEDLSDRINNAVSAEDITLSPFEERQYNALRTWRNEQAVKDGLEPYMIAHNIWLKQMVKNRVRNKEDLIRIKGFGEKRTEKYWSGILKVMDSSLSVSNPPSNAGKSHEHNI